MKKNIAIKVRNIIAGYDDDIILNDISFDVYSGEIFVILGGSGCGKSTLLRHMIGLNTPKSGHIFINEVDITSCDDELYHQALRNIGILFQSSALFGSMTIFQNISLPIEEYTELSPEEIEALVGMKLNMVDLYGYGNFFPSELSGGMKKRAGLARALALNPKILFLDEPSAGLDPVTSSEIDHLILNINKSTGTTMIIVTHELDSIFNVADRIIMLDKEAKGIIAEGDPAYLMKNSDNGKVKRFFNRNRK